MERRKVKSSNIESIGYDHENLLLEIEFKNGKVYNYTPITFAGYQSLINAKSIGSHFFKNIKMDPKIEVKRVEQ